MTLISHLISTSLASHNPLPTIFAAACSSRNTPMSRHAVITQFFESSHV